MMESGAATVKCRTLAGLRAGGLPALVAMAGIASLPAAAQAPTQEATDPATCQLVRLSDIGWTDVTSTTAIFSALLHHLGYRTQTTVLSVPVTYASLKNNDIDVFLGNWMPSMEADRKSYVADGSVEVIRHNLVGAKYTLAVPAYTYAAGLRSFQDIQRFAAQLNSSIYGIEPGNDGNRLVLGMLKQNRTRRSCSWRGIRTR
jgi:glycine betaine/proline transport system substrate-binding protein